ncbi:unnamed protein product [Nesidiocoris tenuis]|uniref:Uncharacterized protein n=1 Tax=Nesidiocoris tenuis TaxID=355587 RepID=A0A6H5GNY9_9HEMI|nr:unnamed protein product [Nesidiocoris tenuis]
MKCIVIFLKSTFRTELEKELRITSRTSVYVRVAVCVHLQPVTPKSIFGVVLQAKQLDAEQPWWPGESGDPGAHRLFIWKYPKTFAGHVFDELRPYKKKANLVQSIHLKWRLFLQRFQLKFCKMSLFGRPRMNFCTAFQKSTERSPKRNCRYPSSCGNRHQMFKERLMLHLKKKHTEREMREKRLTATYSFRVQEWLRKVEKVENSQKRKAREMKNREFFEKVFPRLRKQREDRERFNRVGARVKSEADLEEIMDGLQEQEVSLSNHLEQLHA